MPKQRLIDDNRVGEYGVDLAAGATIGASPRTFPSKPLCNAQQKRRRIGKVRTDYLTARSGIILSRRLAAQVDMRRPVHEVHTPVLYSMVSSAQTPSMSSM